MFANMNTKLGAMAEFLYPARVAALRRKLQVLDCDTAWILQPENRRYLSGFQAEDMQLTESAGSLLLGSQAALLVTDSRYTLQAQSEAVGFEVFTLRKDFLDDLPEVLARIHTTRLGFEGERLTWGLYRRLSKRLSALPSPVELIPMDSPVEELRLLKDTQEIRALEASADMISAVLDRVIEELEPGMTEADVAWRIKELAREAGAQGMAFPPIVASGPNGALPHAEPGPRRLQTGEPIVFDVGVKLDGYCSDLSRTVFLGEPSERFKTVYATVRRAQQAAIAEIRPGVSSTHPDAIARQVILEAGFGDFFGHALGHGVGLATHERPRLAPRKPVELQENMVVTVEPGIYLPGEGGVRLEEMVVIEKTGVRVLTNSRHLYEFAA